MFDAVSTLYFNQKNNGYLALPKQQPLFSTWVKYGSDLDYSWAKTKLHSVFTKFLVFSVIEQFSYDFQQLAWFIVVTQDRDSTLISWYLCS